MEYSLRKYFLDNVNWRSTDVKTYVKQHEVKELVALFYNNVQEALSKHEILI